MAILPVCINQTSFSLPGQTSFYRGKVREVYTVNDELMIAVASDRISAFDHILPRPIPYKGQVLNQLAAYFLKSTEDIVPNWLLATPDPSVSIGYICKPYRVEMVIRAYLTGHAWREYKAGQRTICGVAMPDGLKEHDKFPAPIITPATKAEEGHDEDISKAAIIKQGIVSAEDYALLEQYTYQLFERGTAMAKERDLILVDTKYEFGKRNGQIYLIDEVHTPDSSRYFYAESYETNQANGRPQQQLSKEFVREWLMSYNFQGKEGQIMPFMSDDFVLQVSERYVGLFEQLTGKSFQKRNEQDLLQAIESNIVNWLSNYEANSKETDS